MGSAAAQKVRVVYAALDDGRVVAYGLSKRERRWEPSANRFAGAFAGGPAIDGDGRVWVATAAGELAILDHTSRR